MPSSANNKETDHKHKQDKIFVKNIRLLPDNIGEILKIEYDN